MSGPPAAVAAVRRAVRAACSDVAAGRLVLVACSGGPDSLALAAALAHEQQHADWQAGLLTVDHGLQVGSAERAGQVVAWAASMGLAPAQVLAVTVTGPGGPEAAARQARYAALDEAAARLQAAAVLLGHTADDQAETVLLGLARGSGARSLAGMAPVRGSYRRPLLDCPRTVTLAAAEHAGVPVWTDPHNSDDAYARARLRALLPELERAAPGITAGLVRSAGLLRADADALDWWAARASAQLTTAGVSGLSCAGLAELPAAVRTRVLRSAALAAGVPAGALAAVHVRALAELVCRFPGRGPVMLPGGVTAVRVSDRLSFPTSPGERRTEE